LPEGALFISTYYRATRAKARPVNEVKFCAQQMIIPKEKKKQEEETVVAQYEKPRLGLGGLQAVDVNRRKKN
jgi:hypothetical protein